MYIGIELWNFFAYIYLIGLLKYVNSLTAELILALSTGRSKVKKWYLYSASIYKIYLNINYIL